MKPAPNISDAEWEVMKVVWKKAPCSAQQIVDELAATTEWTAPTIKTLINRLLRKGALEFEKIGKAYLYSPAWTEDECRGKEAQSFLDRVFDGALSPMLAHFVRAKKLSAQDLRELERILKQK